MEKEINAIYNMKMDADKMSINPPMSLQKESEKYKRECDHGETLNWKACPECREFMVRKGFEDEIATAISNREKEIAEGVENLKERQLKREEVISLVNRKFLNASLPSKDIMKNVYDVFEENHLKTVTVFNKALEKVLSILKH